MDQTGRLVASMASVSTNPRVISAAYDVRVNGPHPGLPSLLIQASANSEWTVCVAVTRVLARRVDEHRDDEQATEGIGERRGRLGRILGPVIVGGRRVRPSGLAFACFGR
jgi:hypothetical protein